MIQYSFTIKGNHDDPCGNPVPKLKMTGKQHWTPKARGYVDWKAYVARAFAESLEVEPIPPTMLVDHRIVDPYAEVKPITIPEGRKAHMSIMIHYQNNKRPDPENVFGSIADALFVNDKYLAGSFDFAMEPTGKGRVDVIIKI